MTASDIWVNFGVGLPFIVTKSMSLTDTNPAQSSSASSASPAEDRPLVVPPGMQSVRLGPTSPAELERLLVNADGEPELSGIRVRPAAGPGLWRRLLSALGLSPR